MPTIETLENDVIEEISSMLPVGYQLLGLKPTAEAAEALAGVELLLRQNREKTIELSRDDLVALGVVLAQQYLNEFSWSWVNLVYPDGNTFSIVNPDRSLSIEPLNWVYEIANDPDREIAIVLNFNMVRAGNVPSSSPDSAVIFH